MDGKKGAETYLGAKMFPLGIELLLTFQVDEVGGGAVGADEEGDHLLARPQAAGLEDRRRGHVDVLKCVWGGG